MKCVGKYLVFYLFGSGKLGFEIRQAIVWTRVLLFLEVVPTCNPLK